MTKEIKTAGRNIFQGTMYLGDYYDKGQEFLIAVDAEVKNLRMTARNFTDNLKSIERSDKINAAADNIINETKTLGDYYDTGQEFLIAVEIEINRRNKI